MLKHCVLFSAGLNIQRCIEDEVARSGVEDESFHELSRKMAGYLLDSKSVNTVKKYNFYFNKWEKFVSSKGGSAIPASPIIICLFLTDLLDRGYSDNVVSSVVYSIKWAHNLKNLPDPTDNLFVKNLLDTSKRVSHRPTVKKDPVSSSILIDLCDKYIGSNDILIIRDLCMILLGFAGFLRFDELSNIRCNDIEFYEGYFKLVIPKSKTDQYRFGNEVLVSKGNTTACPFLMLQRYLAISEQGTEMSKFLFRPCFRSKGLCRLIYKDKPLSYTRARETIVSRLKEVSGNLNIGLHSLRSGGATTAGNSENVNERRLMVHGRWKSSSSKDGYVADSLDNRLAVSRALVL